MEAKIKLRDAELANFCDQMHLIVSSSIYIVDGMVSVIEGFSDDAIKEKLSLSKESLEGNNSLSFSLLQSGLFPEYMLTMIEIGETSGKTDQVLQSLALYYKKQEKLKGQIKNAITYPIVIALMVVIIMVVLVTKVLPIFGDVFANLGGSVPLSVALVSQVSKVFVYGFSAVFAGVIFFVLYLLGLSRTQDGKAKARKILIKIPLVRGLYYKLQTAQFANALSLLVSSGYDIHRSLEMAERIMEEESYKQKIHQALADLDQGQPLAEAINNMHIFKGIHGQVIKLAVQTGYMDTVLRDLSEEYTEDVERGVDQMIGIIEPTLVGTTALVIGGILLTVMLPLLGIMSSIG